MTKHMAWLLCIMLKVHVASLALDGLHMQTVGTYAVSEA